MEINISHDGINNGNQIGLNYGKIIFESKSLDQACLQDLRTTDPHDDKERIKNTNGGLLEDSYRWVFDNNAFKEWQGSQRNRLLWIRGNPGKGKTMILCGIIDKMTRLHENSAIISFFFCQATDIRINSATSVLRGLIYVLVEKNLSLLRHVRARYDSAGKGLFEDINAWSVLVSIFTQILEDSSLKSVHLVVDALDECQDGRQDLLDLIVEMSATQQKAKWIISSRNEYEITESLGSATHIDPISLELNEASVSEAVNAFIRHKVDLLADKKRYSPETRNEVYRHLFSNSQGTFLWVALVWKNLEDTPRWHVKKKLEMFPPGLDALYHRMMAQVRESEDAKLCKQILGTVSIVYRPVTLSELGSLLEGRNDGFEGFDILSEIIATCGSFLTVRENTVAFVHQSAKDFLLQEGITEILPRGKELEHHAIFSLSLEIVFRTLRRNIFGVNHPGIPVREIGIPSPNPLAIAEYACIYWVDHLQASKGDKTSVLSQHDMSRIDVFLKRKYLLWLEALSVLGRISDGIQAMQNLGSFLVQENEVDDLLGQAQDAHRFVRYHRTGIESSPLQVYCSSLIFSPSKSLTRIVFQKERAGCVLNNPVVEENWSPCLQTLEGHCDMVNSIAWSPDGSRLASGSDDKTALIWDLATGQSVCTLEGHNDRVDLLAWSPDGSRLASGSGDTTIRIWDPATGQSLFTLEWHIGSVRLLTWSLDGSRLASGSEDTTVRIWDPATGQSVSTLKRHNNLDNSLARSSDESRLTSEWWDYRVWVYNPATGKSVASLRRHDNMIESVAWSPDGSRLASGSEDDTVRIWDPATGQSVSTLEGHQNRVWSITWSPDGTRLASGSVDTTVRIWNPATGQSVFTLEGHNGRVRSLAWSPDGSRLASASLEGIIRIWDPATGQSMSTLEGHLGGVWSIFWSPDGSRLASTSSEAIIRIWDLATGQSVFTLEGHNDLVNSIAWSPDGSRLASGSNDKTVRIWDPATSQTVSTFDRHNDRVDLFAWSPDGSRFASVSDDNTVRIWDPATSQTLFTFDKHSDTVKSHSCWLDSSLLAWSPDGSRLALGSYYGTVQIWDPAAGQSVSTLEGHTLEVLTIAWSPDGSRLASGSTCGTVQIWDPATGQSMSTLEGHRLDVLTIAWSPDGSQLASGASDKTVRIWDPTTGQCVSTLKGHYDSFHSIAWSPGGSRLASGSTYGTIQIWDPATSQSMSTLGRDSNRDNPVMSIAWSPNGSRLASGSDDKTVRIWDLATGKNVSTLEGHCAQFQFDKADSNRLHTSLGIFDASSMALLTPETDNLIHPLTQSGYGLSDDRSWITYNGFNLLWLPSEYRPVDTSHFAIHATTMAIACSSNRIIFLVLSKRCPISIF